MDQDENAKELATRRQRHELLLASLPPVVGFLVFLHTCWYGFVWDDTFAIVHNQSLRHWTTLAHNFFGPLDPTASMYRPITATVAFFEFQVFHLHPWGYHLVNILFHALACALVYQLARRLCAERSVAVFASLLFAVHAVHLESVAWISAVAESMVASAIMAGLICYLRYRREPKPRWLAATCLCLFLGLLIKETAVVLPLLVIAFEVSSGELKSRAKRLIYPDMTAMGLTIAVYLVMRQVGYGAMEVAESKLPFSTLVFTWPSLLVFYLEHLIAPVSLSPFYDTYYVTAANRSFWMPLLVLLAVLVIGLYWRKRSANPRLVVFCLLSTIIPIVPALDLRIFQWRELAHDRFLYVPSIFFGLLVGQLFFVEWNGTGTTTRPAVEHARFALRRIYFVLAGAVVLFYAVALLLQSPPWKSDFALWSYAVKMAPNNVRPAFSLAREQIARGNLREAERLLERVVQLAPEPKDAGALYLLSVVRMGTGHAETAEPPLRQAIVSAPQRAGLHLALGKCLRMQGKKDEARAEFLKELALSAKYRGAAEQELSRLNSP